MLENHDDIALLRRYAEEHSEGAFAEIVRRHVNVVYHAALRQVDGSSGLAEDVTQAVFADLARKAAALTGRPALTGWLYTSTRFAAIKARRGERRRQIREQEAHLMHELTQNSVAATDWARLRPVIDEALHALDERDREAVLWRFFEGESFAEIGRRMSLAEDAARKRVERALEKLHVRLSRRGVTSSTVALGLALGTQAGIAAPTGLAAAVTSGALAGGALGGAATAGAMAFMNLGKIVWGVAGAALLAGLGAAFVAVGTAREAQGALVDATARQTVLTAKLAGLEKQVPVGRERLREAEAQNARLLTTVRKVKLGTVRVDEAITAEIVSARFKRAQELMTNGDPAVALSELLWCFDVGLKRVPVLWAVRQAGGAALIGELAKTYPPARAALETHRDKVRELMLAGDDEVATGDFGAINRALKEGQVTLAAYDQLPPEDPRRKILASEMMDELVAARRYDDALKARPYASLSATAQDLMQPRAPAMAGGAAEPISQASRDYVVNSVAQSIEILAGAGDLAHARTLVERLLVFDGSDATRAKLRQQVARAGQPELLAAPGDGITGK